MSRLVAEKSFSNDGKFDFPFALSLSKGEFSATTIVRQACGELVEPLTMSGY